MGLIEQISYYVNMVGIVALVTLSVAVGVLYYLIKVKKVTARIENIDTTHFRREDSISYVPIKDIVSKDGSLDSEGMIVIDNYNFVAGISVGGFDYPAASSAERIDAQVNAVQFFNVVEKPTSFRQSVKSIDIGHNIETYIDIEKDLARQLLDMEAEYAETFAASEQFLDEPDMYRPYAVKMDELMRSIRAKRHMLSEVNVLLEYMNKMSGDEGKKESAVGQKSSQIMFSYTFNPDEYSTKLTRDEIYLKALEQLHETAMAYSQALAGCHFKPKRLTARELIGVIRKHTSPVTGESMSIDSLLDSSYTALFVSSDSLIDEYKRKIGEEVYERKVTEYNEQLEAYLREEEKKRGVYSERLKEKSYELAKEEMIARGEEV